MKKRNFFILLLCITTVFETKAQETTDSIIDNSGVVIFADPRLEALMASMKTKSSVGSGNRSGSIRSGRGFRVQIYNGNDRIKANAIKLDFMRRYPAIRVYQSYIQPQFRVKVGDFRSRAEAREMYQELSRLYSPVIIVPDIIVINTFRDDQ